MTIYTFDPAWYEQIVTQKFVMVTPTQSSNRMWGGGIRVSNPYAHFYTNDITFAPMHINEALYQDVSAFFARLKGRSNVIRIGHASRLMPYRDRNTIATTATFSDGSTFTDGSGFANGLLPPSVYVAEAAARGATYLVLGGFPASTADVLRRGDRLEVKPNGIPAAFPHMYEPEYGGSSDASGLVGFDLNRPLNAAVAAGDEVSLRNPTTLFHKATDREFEPQESDGAIANMGGSLVEALDLIP